MTILDLVKHATDRGTAPSNKVARGGYYRDSPGPLLVMSAFAMLQIIGHLTGMFHLNNLEPRRSKRWWVAVALLAVCSITVSVATRYSVPGKASDSKVTTVRNHVDIEPIRQRLLNNAASWMPPVVGSAILAHKETLHRVLWIDPPAPRVFFEESLSNRPPPFNLV